MFNAEYVISSAMALKGEKTFAECCVRRAAGGGGGVVRPSGGINIETHQVLL